MLPPAADGRRSKRFCEAGTVMYLLNGGAKKNDCTFSKKSDISKAKINLYVGFGLIHMPPKCYEKEKTKWMVFLPGGQL